MDNRLLHAAARGARVQLNLGSAWVESCTVASLQKHPDDYRVHPDDEHLLYGPISSALRAAAVEPPCDMDMAFAAPNLMLFAAADPADYTNYEDADADETRRWFLLMLAEELSWSGS